MRVVVVVAVVMSDLGPDKYNAGIFLSIIGIKKHLRIIGSFYYFIAIEVNKAYSMSCVVSSPSRPFF